MGPWVSKAARIFEERYMEGHNREQDVLRWATTQPAIDQSYGIGVYVLHHTPTVRWLRDEATIVKDATVIAKKLYQELIEGELVTYEPVSEEAFTRREEALNLDDIVDTTIISARTIKARILNANRHGFNATVSKRIIRAIRCGITKITYSTNEFTGELTPEIIDTYHCKLKDCGRPICNSHSKTKRAQKVKTARVKICQDANKNNRIPYLITTSTPWPLPKTERRYHKGDPSLPKRARYLKTSPLQDNEQNLTLKRLRQHEQHRRELLSSTIVKERFATNSHYTTEIAHLTPSTNAMRMLPNINTHIITSFHRDAPIELIQKELQDLFIKISAMTKAKVFVSPIYADDHSHTEVEDKQEALDQYLGKQTSITQDVDQPYGLADTEPLRIDTPQAHEVLAALDDRSLYEIIDMHDFGKRVSLAQRFNYERKNKSNALTRHESKKKRDSNPSPTSRTGNVTHTVSRTQEDFIEISEPRGFVTANSETLKSRMSSNEAHIANTSDINNHESSSNVSNIEAMDHESKISDIGLSYKDSMVRVSKLSGVRDKDLGVWTKYSSFETKYSGLWIRDFIEGGSGASTSETTDSKLKSPEPEPSQPPLFLDMQGDITGSESAGKGLRIADNDISRKVNEVLGTVERSSIVGIKKTLYGKHETSFLGSSDDGGGSEVGNVRVGGVVDTGVEPL